jgi:hypothetical protein
MGMGLIVPSLLDVTKAESRQGLLDCPGGLGLPGKSASIKTVPQTDTGGLVEHTEALERTVLKELGKLPS